ncbi:hypothetical protein [Marinicella litoralis]|uniref:Uncharacterized protein n=1 Tax=Marinicella litoralis TaxID=644220 RepID=A0A4R6XXQ9_9GAMM|nr:hypothetical protein [Marinicella litoralis]TDR23399.1 hypothetical protein C8D91_0260 [Marinicella litoralis]
MPESINSRTEVVRDTVVLQLKLIVDGLRDLALMPLCFFAALLGLILHREQPGRYLYRILSYGRISEKWIGLFDDADKDQMEPIKYEGKNFDEMIQKTQTAFESKYIDPEKKDLLLKKLNDALNDINGKMNTKKGPSEQA